MILLYDKFGSHIFSRSSTMKVVPWEAYQIAVSSDWEIQKPYALIMPSARTLQNERNTLLYPYIVTSLSV